MSFPRKTHVLLSTVDAEFEKLVTGARWPVNVEVSFVQDVFDTLFGETETPEYGCLILDGTLDLIRELRRSGIKFPILSLLSDSGVSARIAALDAGSDDCLGPMFSVAELVARTKALCRRSITLDGESGADAESKLTSGDLTLCCETQTVIRGGKTVILTPTETRILRFLLENYGRVVSARQLGSAVWGETAEVPQNLIRVHLTNLRHKLSFFLHAKPIRTIRGRGYMMSESDSLGI